MAKLCVKYEIKSPNSIFVATAFEEHSSVGITNVIRLIKVMGIDFIVIDGYIVMK